MREVIGSGQLRSNALGYLDPVAAGEAIEAVRHGKLIARIEAAARNDPRRTAQGLMSDLTINDDVAEST
jgi:antitoxin (DNA-binding transcriptional repressor) of toxin-antitoxin stability system